MTMTSQKQQEPPSCEISSVTIVDLVKIPDIGLLLIHTRLFLDGARHLDDRLPNFQEGLAKHHRLVAASVAALHGRFRSRAQQHDLLE